MTMTVERFRRPRIAASTRRHRAFFTIEADDIPAWGRCCGVYVALHMEVMLLSGLRWVKKRDGWVSIPAERLEELGLGNRRTRRNAVKRAIRHGWIETRQMTKGHKLEFRLRHEWANLRGGCRSPGYEAAMKNLPVVEERIGEVIPGSDEHVNR
jgi:hypothetical protein